MKQLFKKQKKHGSGKTTLIISNEEINDIIKIAQALEDSNILELKKKLGLDPDVVTCDEQDIISTLQIAFEGEAILTLDCIKKKRLDAYFPKYKLGIEIDEYNHESKNSEYEQSRQFMIESHGITIIRTNPDAADFDMNRLINQIYTQIIKSTKKSLIDNLSKRLLELKFKLNHSIKSKC